MTTLKQAVESLSPKRVSRKGGGIGNAGYDNPRENIDPHVKTKVLSTQEIKTRSISGGLITGESLLIDTNSELIRFRRWSGSEWLNMFEIEPAAAYVATQSWVPMEDYKYDLGNSGTRWKDLYLGGRIKGTSGAGFITLNSDGGSVDASGVLSGSNLTVAGGIDGAILTLNSDESADTMQLNVDSTNANINTTTGKVMFNKQIEGTNLKMSGTISGANIYATNSVGVGVSTVTAGYSLETTGNIIIPNNTAYSSRLADTTPILVFGVTPSNDLAVGSTSLGNTIVATGSYYVITAGGETYAFVIETGTANVGIGTVSPSSKLDVNGAISSNSLTVTTAGPTDALNVAGVNTVFLDSTSNPVTIGGLAGGVDGQHLYLTCVISGANAVTIENNEGGATQPIFLHRGSDESLTGEFGGWILVCHGGVDWHDCSHAKHV